MASVLLTPVIPPFVPGTTVNVYQGIDFFGPGVPPGPVISGPFTVENDGSVLPDGLFDNVPYLLAGQVAGVWRYMHFMSRGPTGGAASGVAVVPSAFITVGTTPRPILGSNINRVDYGIFNDSDADGPVLYLSLGGVAAIGAGPRIGPSGVFPGEDKGTIWKGAISIVSDTPDTNVPYYEI